MGAYAEAFPARSSAKRLAALAGSGDQLDQPVPVLHHTIELPASPLRLGAGAMQIQGGFAGNLIGQRPAPRVVDRLDAAPVNLPYHAMGTALSGDDPPAGGASPPRFVGAGSGAPRRFPGDIGSRAIFRLEHRNRTPVPGSNP